MDAFEQVAERLLPGCRLIRSWPLEGGVSADVHALEIVGSDGNTRRVVVRRHQALPGKEPPPNVTEMEFRLLEQLREVALPVPEPLLLDTSGEIWPSPYLVMAFVEGTTSVEPAHIPQALEHMADLLARIHEVPSGPRWALPAREHPISSVLPLLPASQEGSRLRGVLERRTLQDVPATLCHGDFWPGNLLWHQGQIAAVIDWEDAALGDPMSDLAASRMEVRVKWGSEAMNTYTEHYLARRPRDLTDLPVWELFVGSAAAASMAGWGLPPTQLRHMREHVDAFVGDAAAQIR